MSPFLAIPADQWLGSNELAFAISDRFPVSRGHALVIPKRVVATWFEATAEEQRALMALTQEVKALLERQLKPPPDGWNIGVNVGSAAGQTVPHLHVHLIPRWHGDVPDPRGGVRHVIPGRGNYLAVTGESDLSTGHPNDPFLQRLLRDLPDAQEVDILSAFVQTSGLDLLEVPLLQAIAGGAKVRVLAGDYLGITDPKALRRLLGLMHLADPDWPEGAGLTVRVLELKRLAAQSISFHPKSWRIRREDRTVVWVGSSNLSAAALRDGVEWNLRATTSDRPAACQAVLDAFSALWEQATPLNAGWIEEYARNRQVRPGADLAPDVEPLPEHWDPRPWQARTLVSLQDLRKSGHRRALAAVATGLGKTVLAALDARQMIGGRTTPFRTLVVAHRAEILAQTARTLRSVLKIDSGAESWFLGDMSDLSGQLVLASVQKLSMPAWIDALAQQRFDYAVIDEVHHAEAPTWRRVLDRIKADFILGLTATPERADGRDVAAIFDDVLACEMGIGAGIEEGSLVPFAYYGLADSVDYEQIPWRSGRFAPDELEKALITSSPRMERLWKAWQEHPGQRTLVFCCGRLHARFVAQWLRDRGVPSAAVFSGEGSDDRAGALADLVAGRIQALCAVDLFNEGIDLPLVDRVIMLRPTESSVVLTQQLGRGLRSAAGKTRLVAIDFVGNHRMFGWRMRHILSLAGLDGSTRDLQRLLDEEPLKLAPGCLVDVELAARNVLERFLPKGGDAVVDAFRALLDELDHRPTPMELFHRGFLPSTLRAKYGGWFDFLQSEERLDANEQEVLRRHGDWLRWVETTSITKSYKLVVLRTLCDADALVEGEGLETHAAKARAYMLAHPRLREDLQPTKEMPDHTASAVSDWAAWWKRWPIDHSEDWLSVENGRIVNRLKVQDDLVSTLVTMTSELVDWRLAEYVYRRLDKPSVSGFVAKVSHSRGRPILFLPTREECPGRPMGPTVVELPDGRKWEFRFVKVACNVALPVGTEANQLPELLREWFGTQAGVPGTNATVEFTPRGDAWSVRPVLPAAATMAAPVQAIVGRPFGMVAERPADQEGWVPVYVLAAAAGAFSEEQVPEPMGWLRPSDRRVRAGDFAAQVRGHSMEPTIPDGVWCLFRPNVVGSRNGKILLVQHRSITDPEHSGRFTVKRYRSEKITAGESWEHVAVALAPINPAYKAIQIDPQQAGDLRIIAEFIEVLEGPTP